MLIMSCKICGKIDEFHGDLGEMEDMAEEQGWTKDKNGIRICVTCSQIINNLIICRNEIRNGENLA